MNTLSSELNRKRYMSLIGDIGFLVLLSLFISDLFLISTFTFYLFLPTLSSSVFRHVVLMTSTPSLLGTAGLITARPVGNTLINR